MRIYTDHSRQMILDLATTIYRDPASMQSWRAVYVNIHDHVADEVLTAQFLSALEAFQHEHYENDCDMVCCEDGDLLLISKHLAFDEMETLAIDMCTRLDLITVPELHSYDVCKDWRSILDVLQTIEPPQTAPATSSPISLAPLLEGENTLPEHNPFGDMEALREVFDAVRQARPSRNPIHILLVEDDTVTRRLVSNLFKGDFAIITAETAEEAITNYMLYAPDIVFLDIGLPDRDGFDVLTQLVNYDDDAYIVMFSGNSYLSNVTQAMTSGASGFIAKPFKRETLNHYIHVYAEQHCKHAGV